MCVWGRCAAHMNYAKPLKIRQLSWDLWQELHPISLEVGRWLYVGMERHTWTAHILIRTHTQLHACKPACSNIHQKHNEILINQKCMSHGHAHTHTVWKLTRKCTSRSTGTQTTKNRLITVCVCVNVYVYIYTGVCMCIYTRPVFFSSSELLNGAVTNQSTLGDSF